MTSDAQSALAADVERDLQRYNAAFIQANLDDNPALMLPWLRRPVMRFGIGTVLSAATPDDVTAMYQRMIDGLKGTGYARSILSDFNITELNPTTAMVRCHAVRQRADDTTVEEFEAAYIMTLADDRWQVSCLMSQRRA